MPDLPNREAKEGQLQSSLNGLLRTSKRPLIDALGNPPDFRNVPPGFWETMKEDARERSAAFFIVVFLLAGRNLLNNRRFRSRLGNISISGESRRRRGTVSDDLRRRAAEYGQGRARIVDGLVDGIRDRLSTFDGTERGRTQIKALIDRAYAGADIARVAATETTAALTAGERSVIDDVRAAGVEVEVIWWTEADGRVCPICEPLHGLPEDRWPPSVGDGPPAHPNCRCWISVDREDFT